MIRRYKIDDVKSIVALEEETLGTTLGENMLIQELDNKMSYYYVYEDNKEILGYISLSFDGVQGEILNFCVKKNMQRRGIGTKLICHALDKLYSLGAECFILEVRESNANAIALYKKLGFNQVSIRKSYYNNGENALVLFKAMIDYKEIEEEYIKVFCQRKVFDDYIEYYALDNSSKYYCNFYSLKHNSDILMERLIKERNGKFAQFELPNPYQGNIKITDKTTGVRMHSSIETIKFLDDKGYTVKRLDDDNYVSFLGFMYMDNIPNGEKFATENSNALVNADYEKHKLQWYIVYSGDMIVGTLSAFPYKNCAKIEDFFILDEYQKMGYGSSVFKYCIDSLKKQGITDIYLTADQDDTAIKMYERMGFTILGYEYVVRIGE